MSEPPSPDRDPRSDDAADAHDADDAHAVLDRLRERRCPVSSEPLQWSLLAHEDVVRALHDPATFSNAVSRHPAVPNGMDPPEHTAYRRLIDPYFAPARMRAFEPACREIATELVGALVGTDPVEVMSALALPFAVRAQCAFLGWPAELHGRLIAWTRRNHEATRAQDRPAMAAIAQEFEALVGQMLDDRGGAGGADPEGDVTAELMRERIDGRALTPAEIASILRNWTVGEVGTIAASVGIVVHHLARHPALQEELRDRPAGLSAAIDEILRIDGPLPASRRVTTRAVEIGGCTIPAGARVSLLWPAANRDGRVFEDPGTCRPDRDPGKNLLYGAGIHACPGAPLARLELRLVLGELLRRTASLELSPDERPRRAVHPASGFATLVVSCRPARGDG